MKNIIYFLSFYLFVAVLGNAAPVGISWPLDYSVFQRNTTSTGGSTTVAFAGQFNDGSSTQFRIESLSNTGSGIGDWKSYQSLPSGSETILGTSVSTYFYFTFSVPTGWYRFYIKDGSGTETSIKFGVGEVFIIAGQSNAQGAATTQNITGLSDLDCVVSIKNYFGSSLSGYANIEKAVFGPLNSSNSTVGPRSDRRWFYQALGNSIATKESGVVIPVCFMNVAHGGSSIDNWYDSMQRVNTMFSSNYGNVMTVGSTSNHQNPWGAPATDNRFPYVDLKNAVSSWGNMFGVRSVIWHQGEAETKTLLSIYHSGVFGAYPVPGGYSIGNYDTKLNAIIADTRSLLPGLPWAVSKATLMHEYQIGSATANDDIVNNSGNNLVIPSYTTTSVGGEITQEQANVTGTSSVSYASDDSDTYTTAGGNRSDGTHFNEDGLKKVHTDVYGNISSILGKTPVLPNLPQRIQLSQVGTQHHTVSTTGGYSQYHWFRGISSTQKFDQTSLGQNNNWTSSTAPDLSYSGYVKDGSGRVYSVVPQVYLSFISGARRGVVEADSPESVVYPNPVIDGKELRVKFTLRNPSPVKILLFTENGVVMQQIYEKDVAKGEHNYTISLEKLQLSEASKVFYHLKTNEHEERKNILLIK